MSDTVTPRYGYEARVPFAATRAYAERQARETAARTAGTRPSRRTQNLIRKFVRITASS